MEKISSADLNAHMVKVAQVMRGLQTENSQLKQKLASFERKEQAVKIASLAVERGALSEEDAEDYAESLATGGENLEVVKDFVGRTSRALSLGKTLEKVASDNGGDVDGQDVLTTYLLSSEFAE